jgi:formamidopyrimidine-DNA glycosylase
MPELPEVETVRRGLEPVLVGRRIERVKVARADLRQPFPPRFAERLTGRTVTAIARRAKYLLLGLDSGETWLVHLGMTGRFTVVPPEGRPLSLGEFYYEVPAEGAGKGPHDHVVIELEGGFRLVFGDPRRFGVMDLIAPGAEETHPLLSHLGIEPLGNALSADALAPLFARRQAPLKAVLSDQKVIAGLGNIYACEVLHRAGLAPDRRAQTLVTKAGAPTPRLEALVAAIRAVLAEAIAAGGSTLRDYAGATGEPGGFQQLFAVYDREGEPCPRPGCGGTIRRSVQGGRSTFWCPRCQR